MNLDSLGDNLSDLEIVTTYHNRTKHYFDRYARSLGYMDWKTQPDPFRRYEDAPLIRLPLPPAERELPYWKLYAKDGVSPSLLTLQNLSLFFLYSLSITAWKNIPEATWALRVNPSSGNLHPTEGYVLLPKLEGLHDHPGLYHYSPREHGLEHRAEFDPQSWTHLNDSLPVSSFVVGLSSVYWREAWKYGERAFRYCQHDVGHALGTLRLAAAALGWSLRLLDTMEEPHLSRLLGLDRKSDFKGADQEYPELLALVSPGLVDTANSQETLKKLTALGWYGKANLPTHTSTVDWPVIDQVSLASENRGKDLREDLSGLPSEQEVFTHPIRTGSFTAEKIILGRRSALAMDGQTALPIETFYNMMGRLIPTQEAIAPWDVFHWRPRIHFGIFVHRVTGLSEGLYVLVRDPKMVESLKASMDSEFLWKKPAGCPTGLPLYLLQVGDFRGKAAGVSCGQSIAGDGAFSLGMIADFQDSLALHGASFYRNLFWEAGLVGQVLYLEAEEAGIRATGIGCYFDDPVHQIFGMTTQKFQSLYHFTVGAPVEDNRLTTLPAYE